MRPTAIESQMRMSINGKYKMGRILLLVDIRETEGVVYNR